MLAPAGFLIGSILAIRFGRSARRVLASDGRAAGGWGRATAAMILGIVGVAVTLVGIAQFVVVLLHHR
jgi:hypothetical protein